jgi:hypothetical protein
LLLRVQAVNNRSRPRMAGYNGMADRVRLVGLIRVK